MGARLWGVRRWWKLAACAACCLQLAGYAPGALPQMWREAGLVEVDGRSLMIRIEFADFADYWEPFASGEGGLGAGRSISLPTVAAGFSAMSIISSPVIVWAPQRLGRIRPEAASSARDDLDP